MEIQIKFRQEISIVLRAKQLGLETAECDWWVPSYLKHLNQGISVFISAYCGPGKLQALSSKLDARHGTF